MIGTGAVLSFATGLPALIGIYIFYGALMGTGLGIGYLTPVKTLMLWFKENKGLATGISIMGFGLAKAIASPIMIKLQNSVGIVKMFIILGIIYCGVMYLGHILLQKPKAWIEPHPLKSENPFLIFKNKVFIGIWLMFFINIHCGLMIISYEKQILNTAFIAVAALSTIISVVPSCTAIANALGRIGYSTVSDKCKQRNTIYKIIFISCIIISILMISTNAINGANSFILGALVITYLLIINAGYGGGFSTLPTLLQSKFGMEKISTIHGMTLSAWAFAGLSGNQLSNLIINILGWPYEVLFVILFILYGLALYLSYKILNH